jgi:hypothetical protein
MTEETLRCHLDKLWVINAEKEFAWRRYRAEAGRNFDKIKAEAMESHGVDIECCREHYFRSAEEIFTVVGDILVDTKCSKPHRIEPWEDAKRRIHGE